MSAHLILGILHGATEDARGVKVLDPFGTVCDERLRKAACRGTYRVFEGRLSVLR